MLLLQVSPECGALVLPGATPGQSTFGKLTTGTIPSSAATLIPRAARERRVSAVSPEAQFPSGQVSSFGAKGLQRLSTSRQSARTLMKARPEVNPIQKQWTDVGPGAYSPPSTCVRDALVRLSGGSCEGAHAWWYVCGACLSFGDGKGAAAVLPKNLSGSRRAATASGRRGRRQRSGAPGRLGQTSQVSSLKDWLACVTRRCVVAVGGCDGDTSQPWWWVQTTRWLQLRGGRRWRWWWQRRQWRGLWQAGPAAVAISMAGAVREAYTRDHVPAHGNTPATAVTVRWAGRRACKCIP